MSFVARIGDYFEWPSEYNHRTLPVDAKIKTLILDMTCRKVDRIQIHMTSCQGEIYSQEIGGVGIRGSMVVKHLQSDTDIRSVGYSGGNTRVLRLYDADGGILVDSNPDYDGDFTIYEVPSGHKLIGFNGSLRNQKNLENIGIITCEQ